MLLLPQFFVAEGLGASKEYKDALMVRKKLLERGAATRGMDAEVLAVTQLHMSQGRPEWGNILAPEVLLGLALAAEPSSITIRMAFTMEREDPGLLGHLETTSATHHDELP
jgi:hypothetical protein